MPSLIGNKPNQVPTNGDLGTLAFQDASNIAGPVVIGDNSTNAALRITQLGTGNALLVEDSSNPDATPFVIDASGNVVIGTTSQLTTTDTVQKMQIVGTSGQTASTSISYWNNVTFGPELLFTKSRGSVGAYTIVNNGDPLGKIRFWGTDGTGAIEAASIATQVDGTPGTNDMPGRLVFSTTADGASSPTERMRIDNKGSVGIGSSSLTGINFRLSTNITGAVASSGMYQTQTVQSDVTTGAYGKFSSIGTAAAAFTLPFLRHNHAEQGTFGAGSTVTNQYGYFADSSLTGATNNYGFYGNIASGTGRYNFYAGGTADNYFAGNLGLGVTPSAWGSTTKSIDINTGAAIYAFAGNSVGLSSNAYYNGTNWIYKTTNASALYAATSGVHAWYNAPSGTAAGTITFTQAMTLDASGNLGIGTTSPAKQIDVQTANNTTVATIQLRDSQNRTVALSSPTSTADAEVGTTSNHDLIVRAGASGGSSINMRFNTVGTERMRIDSSGNVGVGTTSPKSPLNVSNNITTNDGGYLKSLYYSSGWKYSYNSTSLGFVIAADSNGVYFSTAPASGTVDAAATVTERMRIDSSGNLLVGGTTSLAKFSIYQDLGGVGDGQAIRDTGSSYGTGAVYIKFQNNAGSQAGAIQHTASTTVAYATSSDQRLKENIVDSPNAIDKLMNIPVRSYDWKEDKVHVEYGFVAQELANIYAEPVGVGGENEKENPWNVEYGRLTPLLVKAIQELKAELDSLKAQLNK